MRDFTIALYKKLLKEFIQGEYKFVTFAYFLLNNTNTRKTIILRHDIDRLPEQALVMAKIEHEMGVNASYYFRYQHGFDEVIIRSVAALGHEIGYHYEDFSCAQGNFEKAIAAFEKNLKSLRKLAEVITICMHGSPLGKFDNRKLWEKYKYHNFGIIGEPYFDLDFSKVLYLTDTGRCWNGDRFNIRDRTDMKHSAVEKLKIRGTSDLFRALAMNALPDQILLNAHPHRWFDFGLAWVKELLIQNMKNSVKAAVKYFRND